MARRKAAQGKSWDQFAAADAARYAAVMGPDESATVTLTGRELASLQWFALEYAIRIRQDSAGAADEAVELCNKLRAILRVEPYKAP